VRYLSNWRAAARAVDKLVALRHDVAVARRAVLGVTACLAVLTACGAQTGMAAVTDGANASTTSPVVESSSTTAATTAPSVAVTDGASPSTTSPVVESTPTAAATTAPPVTTIPSKSSVCSWRGAVVNGDGAGQHYATVLGFTNVGGVTCSLPRVDKVVGERSGGRTVLGIPGGFFPISPAAEAVVAGDRVELVLTTTNICQPSAAVPLLAVDVTLSDGSQIRIPESDDARCGLWFSQLGSWD